MPHDAPDQEHDTARDPGWRPAQAAEKKREPLPLEALLFDFDGVVVDSEPTHREGLQQIRRPLGVVLAQEDYYSLYLGLNDRDCLEAVSRRAGVDLAPEKLASLIETKTRLVQAAFAQEVKALPGAVDLVRAAHAGGIPLAICSGALREEILLAAGTLGVRDCFQVVVSAEDVVRGKPDPSGFRLALERLSAFHGRSLGARRTLVVEDSPAGIEAALALGMQVLAVTNSYGAEFLTRAHRIVHSLAEVTLEQLAGMTGG